MISGTQSRLRFAARTKLSHRRLLLIGSEWNITSVYIEGVAAAKAAAGKLNHLFKCVDGLRMGDEVELVVFCVSHQSPRAYSFSAAREREMEYKSGEYANDAHAGAKN